MTRQELYDLVWSKPMTHAAKKFGISDVALRKTCVKHNIPTPPLGYWAKLAHGKSVHKPLLPKLDSGDERNIYLTEKPEQDLPEAVTKAILAARSLEEAAQEKIAVCSERPAELHPVTLATEKALKRAAIDLEGFCHCAGDKSLAVAVGQASIGRAILLIETIIRAFASRGCAISFADGRPEVICNDERFELKLYETKDKRPYELTTADIKRQADHDADVKRMPSLYLPRRVTPTWTYFPSGRLCFEVSDPTKYQWNSKNIVGRWYDRVNKPVHEYIADSIVAVAGAAAHNKILRAEEEERARLHAARVELQRREQAQRKQDKDRKDYLKKKALDFDEFSKLKALSQHLEAQDALDGLSSFSRMLAVLRGELAVNGQQFTASNMNDEIEKLGLFSLGDAACGGQSRSV